MHCTHRDDCHELLVCIRRSLSLSLSERKRRISKNKKPQQPPNQEKPDDCHDNVTDPLARRFGVSEVEHVVMVASALKAEPRRIRDYKAVPRVPVV